MACDVESEMIEYSNYEYIDNEEIEQNKSDVNKIISEIFLIGTSLKLLAFLKFLLNVLI